MKLSYSAPPFSGKAEDVSITDSGGYYTGTDVEAALQEIADGTTLNGVYLRLDCTNDPLTAGLQIQSNTAAERTLILKSLDDSLLTPVLDVYDSGDISKMTIDASGAVRTDNLVTSVYYYSGLEGTIPASGGNVQACQALHISDASTATINSAFIRYATASGKASSLIGARARGTAGTPLVVTNNNSLFTVGAYGHDGTDFAQSGLIAFEVDGTPGDGDMPGRIKFLTTPDGTEASVEAMRIDSTQQVIINSAGSAPTTANLFQVKASASQTGDMVQNLDSLGTVLSGFNENGLPFVGTGFIDTGIFAGSLFTIDTAGTNARITIRSTDDTGIQFYKSSTFTGGFLYDGGTNVTSFYGPSTTGAIHIASSRFVNVGTDTTPEALLHVSGFSDSLQFLVRGHSTQTANLTEWQNSGGTPLSLVDPSGRVAIGTSTFQTIGTQLQITNQTSQARFDVNTYSNTSTHGSAVVVNRARGTQTSPLAVQNGDIIGTLTSHSWTGASWYPGGQMRVEIDGTVTTTSAPQRVVFKTAKANSATPIETMRMDSTGATIINSAGEALTTANLLQIKESTSHTGNPLEIQNSSGTGYFIVGESTLPGNSSSSNWLRLVGDMPTTMTTETRGVDWQISGSGSSNIENIAFNLEYTVGYSGAQASKAIQITNNNSGTGTSIVGGQANYGQYIIATSAGGTTGNMICSYADFDGGNGGYGYVARSDGSKASATKIGFLSLIENAGVGAVNIGGAFIIESSIPTLTSSCGLLADNGNYAVPIIIGRDAGTEVFKVEDGGHITIGGGVTGVDYTVTFDGETNDGVYKWMEDEDYFQFDDDIYPYARLMLPMGEISYFDITGTSVAIAATSDGSTNMVMASVATTLNNDLEFDNGGANDGTLRYIGATTKMFHVACTISISPAAANDTFVFGVAKNGSVVAASKVLMKVTTGSDKASTAMHLMVSLAQNDTLSLYIGNTTDADDCTVHSLNLFAMGM